MCEISHSPNVTRAKSENQAASKENRSVILNYRLTILNHSDIFAISMKQTFHPLLVRLRPKARQLLEIASREQNRPMAAIIDEAIVTLLADKYSRLDDRLRAFLGSK